MVHLGDDGLTRPLALTLLMFLWLFSGLYTVYSTYETISVDVGMFPFLSNPSVPGWYHVAAPAELFFSTMLLLLGLFQLAAVPGFLIGKYYSYVTGLIVPIVATAINILEIGLYVSAPAGLVIGSDLTFALLAITISLTLAVLSWHYLGKTRVKAYLGVPSTSD